MQVTAESNNLLLRLKDYKVFKGTINWKLLEKDVISEAMKALVKHVETNELDANWEKAAREDEGGADENVLCGKHSGGKE